jgi:hypothetical protein
MFSTMEGLSRKAGTMMRPETSFARRQERGAGPFQRRSCRTSWKIDKVRRSNTRRSGRWNSKRTGRVADDVSAQGVDDPFPRYVI